MKLFKLSNLLAMLRSAWGMELRASLDNARRDLAILRDEKVAAEAANQAKSTFLANMSHELRTPLNAVIGMADLMAETSMTEEQSGFVDIFQRASKNLLSLINDILDLSKIEAGQLELVIQPFSLDDLVEQVIDVLAVPAYRKGLELLGRVDPNLSGHYDGDPDRLRQIMMNLVGNAIKFTDTGEIVLTVEGTEQDGVCAIHMAVRDTGIGVPSEKLDLIFEPFTQADASTTCCYGGTGLGLAICRRLVGLMGGQIWAESHQHEGMVVHVDLTLRRAKGQQNDLLCGKPLQGTRILVVDDYASQRQALSGLLTVWGAKVVSVENGSSAIRELGWAESSGEAYDLALIDAHMPGVTGFHCLQALKKFPQWRVKPILMLTNENRISDLQQVRALEIEHYLFKPLKRKTLIKELLTAWKSAKSMPYVMAAETPNLLNDALRRQRVLLIDDSSDNCLLIQAYLRKFGCQIDVAHDGAAGVKQFKTGDYDVVLMDLHMPVMDGFKATREIRCWETEQDRPATRIFALTASTLQEDVQRSLAAGCDGILTKPIQKRALMEAIAHLASPQAITA